MRRTDTLGDMRVVVGCPIRRREWVATKYVESVAWATVEAGVHDSDLKLMFVSHPDDPTNDVLRKAAAPYGIEVIFLHDGESPTDLERSWSTPRLQTMVRVRNTLLEGVRDMEPDLFLSVDSDILLHPKGVRYMLRLLETSGHRGDRPVAAGSCAYLTQRGRNFPNYAMIAKDGSLRRGPMEGDIPNVDVLMAIKLMTPRAYNVDYQFDKRGEDIGWSNAVRQQGMHLAWTGKITSKHCMQPSELHSVDKRVGY